MTSYVSIELRRLVQSRSSGLCEYCLIHESDTFYGCHVDHVISEKHGGATEAHNLAFACATCNRAKGSDIGSIAQSTGSLTALYNPRTDKWNNHFTLNGVLIVPLTAVGEATENILGFNSSERAQERETLNIVGRYPSPEAMSFVAGTRS